MTRPPPGVSPGVQAEADADSGVFAVPVEAPEPEVVARRTAWNPREFRAGVVVGSLWCVVVLHCWLEIALFAMNGQRGGSWSGSAIASLAGGKGWATLTTVLLVACPVIARVSARRGARWPVYAAVAVALIVLALSAYAISYRVNELTAP
jgi:hypothetical protein